MKARPPHSNPPQDTLRFSHQGLRHLHASTTSPRPRMQTMHTCKHVDTLPRLECQEHPAPTRRLDRWRRRAAASRTTRGGRPPASRPRYGPRPRHAYEAPPRASSRLVRVGVRVGGQGQGSGSGSVLRVRVGVRVGVRAGVRARVRVRVEVSGACLLAEIRRAQEQGVLGQRGLGRAR
eukprot:scaffold35926_cov44-Phaeocystis_antarctica.AAC.1